MRETHKNEINYAVAWFKELNEEQKDEAVRHLFEYAITSEWISVFSRESAEELSKETGKPLANYLAPYFTTCGEPLVNYET